jgi:membrane-associated PAP2 superfamily phosphatase
MRGIEAFLLLAVAIVATVVFAVTPLDVTTARIFFRPETPDHWPLATRLPWSALYRLAPLLTAGLVLAALAGLSFGLLRRRPMWRLYGAFILLSVALGPGLLVNAVFKDHWERPRPRDIVQFEGSMRYVPAPLPGPGGGSFPCGHCSVGFLYGLAYWIWRDRRPRAARLALAAALVAGIVLGIGRMAAGAHFLSDVIWSALVVFGVSHIVYYYVLRIPDRHQASDIAAPPSIQPVSWSTVAAVLGALAVLVALFTGPHGGTLISQTFCFPPSAGTIRALTVTARVSNIEILLVDPPASPSGQSCSTASGELHGFGLPTSSLRGGFELDPVRGQLAYHVQQLGWLTDLSGELAIRVPAGQLEQIAVHLGQGNIKLTDLTHAGVLRQRRVRLDLRTGSGRCTPAELCASRIDG